MTDTQTATPAKSPAPAKAPKKPVAKHELLDSDGNATEGLEPEQAFGYRYTLLALPGEPFVWRYEEASEDEIRMFALFGVRTLATNETSQARNDLKGAASPAEQRIALGERFAGVRDGVWVDRTREGPRVNAEALAIAIKGVLAAAGKPVESDEAYKAKIENDKAYAAKALTNIDVRAAYNVLVGRATATLEDLASL